MTTPAWAGVFPAVTTQFRDDQSLDIEATARHLEALIDAGIHGVVLLGSVGENTALEYGEKLTVLREMLALVNGRIPVLTGVAEYTTALACRYARDAERIGIDGLMVLPAMVYKSDGRETITHFRTVARATGLPIMIYNNPVSYGVDVHARGVRASWPTCEHRRDQGIVGERPPRSPISSTSVGDRFILFCGRGRPGARKRAARRRRAGCRDWSTRSRTRTARCGTSRPPDGGRRRASCTAGTRRCCISTPK